MARYLAKPAFSECCEAVRCCAGSFTSASVGGSPGRTNTLDNTCSRSSHVCIISEQDPTLEPNLRNACCSSCFRRSTCLELPSDDSIRRARNMPTTPFTPFFFGDSFPYRRRMLSVLARALQIVIKEAGSKSVTSFCMASIVMESITKRRSSLVPSWALLCSPSIESPRSRFNMAATGLSTVRASVLFRCDAPGRGPLATMRC
mmetsp:Transcript_21683/g.39196  ORF Transcript_21683/g.39196 Transcript_21683/m.39196 type:complete len:203 (+) Transcript_21683:1096-1704(+)